MMLPWFAPEITPLVLEPGIQRFGGLDAGDAPANVRALVEAQMLAMSIHSAWAVPAVTRIHATGGAARNAEILQVMADVFDAPVYRIHVENAACLGAALRAFHASARASSRELSWDDVAARFAEPVPDLVVRPDPGNATVYSRARTSHADIERQSLGGTSALGG
jgi:xylulokinase